MRYIFLILFFTLIANAGVFDFLTIKKTNESYKNKEYADTIRYLYSLDKENAVINYDLATSYYRLKDYKNALRLYKRAMGRGVDEFNRLYNIGNCYFNLKDYKSAIYAYKEALKIKKDSDALYNLNLAKYKLEHKKLEKLIKPKKKLPKKRKHKKNSKIKDKKFNKEELKKLKEKLKKEALKKEMKRLIKKSFKDKEIPILMYKIED